MRLWRGSVVLAGLLAGAGQGAGWGQENYWVRWQARANDTQVNQPHWATPLVTTNARVEQGLRGDFIRQSLSGGQRQWNNGGGNGLQLIPWRRTELRLSPPPFLSHSDRRTLDGFGDVGFRLKYRVYGSNEQHRNAIVTGLLGATVPTGKQKNGSCCAVLTPALDVGKGFGPVALTTIAAGTLPVSNTRGLGRSVTWNNAVQAHMLKYAWPEVEFNSTWYFGGRNDGKAQTFVTPGLVVSRLPVLRSRVGGQSRLALSLGAGEQIALTHFATYNHALVLTGRLRF